MYMYQIENLINIVYYDSVGAVVRQEKIDRGSISKCIAGSTKYSHVGKRKWRKIGDE